MFKLSNETKVATLAIVAAALGFWGFKFLKGINVLTTSRSFYVRYDHVDQLQTSSPVMIRGFQVGMVKLLTMDKMDDRTIIATLNIDADVDIPKDAVATIAGQSLMGGKVVELVFDHPCEGDGCAESGDTLRGATRSFIQSIVGEPGAIDPYVAKLKSVAALNIDSLARANPNGWAGSVVALDHALRNLEVMTNSINRLLAASSNGISATANNTAELTKNLNASNQDIRETLANLNALSAQLKNAGLDQTSKKAATAIDTMVRDLNELRTTLQTSTRTIGRVDTLAQNLLHGKGTAGQLLNDPKLYENLERSSRQLSLLMADLRLNPKRYTTVKVKLFGKNKVAPFDTTQIYKDLRYWNLVDSLEQARVHH